MFLLFIVSNYDLESLRVGLIIIDNIVCELLIKVVLNLKHCLGRID